MPEQLCWVQVSVDFFRLFGTPIVQGRAFTPEEDLPNGQQVALISEQLWERRFDRDPAVLGRSLSLSSAPYVIIGVVGSSFDFLDFGPAPDVWTPFQLDPNTDAQGHYFSVAGRLKPGVSLTQAQTALEHSSVAYTERFLDTLGHDAVFGAEPIQEMLVRNVRSSLLVLMGAVGFLLLIACANVANLLLLRAAGRKREIALRTAIGAGRGRIVRQLLTESAMLSTTGSALGLGLGVVGIRALLAINTARLPWIGQDGALVGIDWRVLLFALALVLLVGSALLIRTSLALSAVDPGFDATNVVTMRMSLTGPRFATAAGVEQLLREGVDRVRALPGVEHAAATCCVPLQGGFGLPFIIVERPLDRRTVSWRRWLDEPVRWVLRGVQDSGAPWSCLHRAGRQRGPTGGRD